MPTYEYVCTDCRNEWEEIQKISEPPVESCPKCGKSTAKRQISGGNFILKGGGWYADLYSSAPAKKQDKADGGKPDTGSGGSKPDGGSGGGGGSTGGTSEGTSKGSGGTSGSSASPPKAAASAA